MPQKQIMFERSLKGGLAVVEEEADTPRDVAALVDLHGDFIWRTLQRLGVPDADLEDVFHEVLIAVHRRLPSFEGRSKTTTWLYSISVRVASTYRRRAWFRRERPTPDVPDSPSPAAGPEELFRDAEERAALRAVLDLMAPEKRAAFVMYEIEELSCEAIAEMLSLPIGTVHSRLHAARHDFHAALRRWQARQQRPRSLWPFGRSR